LLEQPEEKYGDVIDFFGKLKKKKGNSKNIILKKGIFNKWRKFTTKKKQKKLI